MGRATTSLALSSAGARVAADSAPDTDILFISNDPTATGLVDNERGPEDNLTGVTFRVPADRLLYLTRRLLPGTDPVGVLDSANDPASGPSRQATVDAAGTLGLVAHVESFDGPHAAQGAVDRLSVTAGVDVILLTNSPSTVRALPEIEAAIAPTGLPVVAAHQRPPRRSSSWSPTPPGSTANWAARPPGCWTVHRRRPCRWRTPPGSVSSSTPEWPLSWA